MINGGHNKVYGKSQEKHKETPRTGKERPNRYMARYSTIHKKL
jgi:hypothetical protein